MASQLRIGGLWASAIAPWGSLEWGTKLRGGMDEITFSMDTDANFRHPALRPDVLVEVYDNAQRIGAGLLDEPDVASGSFTARGLYRAAENYLCLTSVGANTSVANTAIDQAIARGLPWRRIASFSTTPYTGDGSTAGSAPNYLHTLLDGVTDEAGTFWSLDPDGAVVNAPLTTVPSWHLGPGLTDLGLAEDQYASDLFGRFFNTAAAYQTVVRADADARAAFGRREAPVDLTPLGPIAATRAQQILDGLLAKGRARPAFTQSLEVSASQLISAGGVEADLSMVQAGQMVRSHGFFDDIRALDGRTYLDWVIGETKYADGEETITLSPQGLAPRDLAAVLAAIPSRASFVA